MPNEFACIKCGRCCKDYYAARRGREEKQGEIDAVTGPVYYLCDAYGLNPPLFGWEVTKLSGLNPEFRYSPRTFVYDENSKTPLIVEYNLEHDTCVFLDTENRCTAYDKRPLICRAYPLLKSGVEQDRLEFSMGSCPAGVDIDLKPLMTDAQYCQSMLDAYGETFLWSILREVASEWLRGITFAAEDKQLLKLLRGVKNPEILNMIGDAKPRDLVSHLLEQDGGLTTEFEKNIAGFYDLDYARRLLDKVL